MKVEMKKIVLKKCISRFADLYENPFKVNWFLRSLLIEFNLEGSAAVTNMRRMNRNIEILNSYIDGLSGKDCDKVKDVLATTVLYDDMKDLVEMLADW